MAKTLNLIIVDDLVLVKPLTERLGFKEAPWCLTDPIWGSQEGITSTLLRQTRHTDEKISDDLLFYFVVSTENVQHARGIGGYPHPSFAFEAAGLPRQLDVEFDRIMLATGFERWVIKERHSHFEGWHKHHNESRLMPLPEGGHVKINDEDPNVDPRFRFPSHRASMKEPHEPTAPVSPGVLTMKPEYAFKSYVPDPNRSDFNWLMIDDVARLDEWAERLKIMNFKPLSDVMNEGLTGLESAMEAAQHRKSNVAKIISSLTEDTTFYTVAPAELLKAAFISLDYSELVRKEAGLPASIFFLPRNGAFITKDYFTSLRGDRGDNWKIHEQSVAPEAKNNIIEEAYQFAVRTLGILILPQTYNACTLAVPRSLRYGPATTVDDTWLRAQLEAAGKPDGREFFNQWVVSDNSFLGADVIKRLRENPSLGEKGSFSRDLFTETQLKQMQDMIPDVFLPDGTIDIAVMSKFYESKTALIAPGMRRRLFPRGAMPFISEANIEGSRTDLGLMYFPPIRTIYESGQSVLADDLTNSMLMALSELTPPKPPIMPSAVLDTINKYLDEVKDTAVTPFDDVQIKAGDDDHSFTVTFTTSDPVMKDLLLKAGAVVVPDVQNNDVAESYPLGRGLTPEATQQLFREQNPHMFEERRVDWDTLIDTGKPTLFPPKDPE
jgi:hypothetical protein